MRASVPIALICAVAVASAEDVAAIQARLTAALDADTQIDAKVRTFAKEKLIPLTTAPVLVAEAKAQDAKKVSLEEIKKIDAAWMAAEDELPIQKEKLGNACALAIKDIAKTTPGLIEVFAMDDQGANVGQLGLTSDYWQGDEDKWQKSFAGGKGGVDVGKAKFDKSAGLVLQQVSLPLLDADGTVVGAITFGVAPDKL